MSGWFAPSRRVEGDFELTPAHKHMYASEKLDNFRYIATLCATHSPYTLKGGDLAPADLYDTLADLGEFAHIAINIPDVRFLFENLEMLLQPRYPFEGFKALRDARLVSKFQGTVAAVTGVVVYRPRVKQLVVAFSGTRTTQQALHDIYAVRRPHPEGGSVHSGFYRLYEGCRDPVTTCIKEAFAENEIQELAVTGHSMGGALSYLFVLEVLAGRCQLPAGVRLTVATFGCPRVGDAALRERWQQLLAGYQAQNGEDSVKEFCVRTLNDGVPALPPVSWGYRHLAGTPLYLYHGRLFHVPASEAEHGAFPVAKEALDPTSVPDHPRGGHNYYNGRDAEKIMRRVHWLERMMAGKASGWEEDYLAKIAELEGDELPGR